MTAVGAITFRRVYFVCPECESGRYAADARLGIDGFLTLEARRLACLAGGQRSFANAELLLKELCGWRISDERIRQACHAEADRIAAWRAGRPTPAGAAIPPTEFQVDATKVNTDTGWRDRKIGVFPQHRGALDIFHACEHLGSAANELFGEGTEAARTWREAGRRALLGDGWYGSTEFVAPTARWTVPNANRMAELCCLTYSAQWGDYWTAA